MPARNPARKRALLAPRLPRLPEERDRDEALDHGAASPPPRSPSSSRGFPRRPAPLPAPRRASRGTDPPPGRDPAGRPSPFRGPAPDALSGGPPRRAKISLFGGRAMTQSRTEKDSLGEKKVPAEAYYGIQTARALENFPISGMRAHPALVRAHAIIK